ncbi:MAG: Ig-like domain-containing protein [Nitrososphaerota archaeon]
MTYLIYWRSVFLDAGLGWGFKGYASPFMAGIDPSIDGLCSCMGGVVYMAGRGAGPSLLSILSTIFVSMGVLLPFIAIDSPIRISAEGSGWSVVSEGVSISKYRFTLRSVANAIRLVLYMDSVGDINSDSIKIMVEGATLSIHDSETEYRYAIVGYTKIGYESDGRGTTRGLHVVYYIFPNATYIQFVTLELDSDHGYPRLYIEKSWIEPLNITAFYWSLKDERYSYGTYYTGDVNPYNSELKVAAVSHGVATGVYKSSSGVAYYYGRAFRPDMVGPVDMYIDVGYMGGFNIAPKSTYGTGRYTIKLDIGVEQSSEVSKAVSDPEYQTLFYEKGGGGIVELATGFAADRVEDILLDLITDYGIELVKSPVGRAMLRFLPYVPDIIEWIEMAMSLSYDRIINGTERVVFKNMYIEHGSGDYIYIWTHFIGLTDSTGLSTNIINFCGNPPWENLLDKYFGAGVWKLEYGGIYVGGIALDYYSVPEVISELPHGERYPATVNISIEFSRPIDRGSLPPYTNSIIVYLNWAEVPFFEYFRYRLSPDNTTLFIYPSYHLEYGSSYNIILTRGIRGINSSNIVRSYELWFTTEYRKQTEPEVYYVLPTAGPYEIQGVLFKAYLYSNVSIDWKRATVSGVPFYIDGIEVLASYVGEATFYTNDIYIDYYDGGSGRLYRANGTLWFTPLAARDGGFPPKRGVAVFRVGDPANMVYRQPARLVISQLQKFGNLRVGESLKSAGIVEGAVFDLEPMPIANYEIISTEKAGEGILVSESEPGLNNTKVTLYMVTADNIKKHGLDKAVEGYRPMYSISLGGAAPLPIDIFVFTIANVSYMRAWRLVPLGYISSVEQQKIYTYTIRLPTTEPMEITVVSNTTVREIDSSGLPYEIRLAIEGVPGRTGYIILTLPKQLGLVVKSATIDGKLVEFREVNETAFSDAIRFRLTYSCIQKSSTLTVHLSTKETVTQTPTHTYTSPTLATTSITAIQTTTVAQQQGYPISISIPVVAISIAVIAIAAIAIVKSRIFVRGV